MDADLFSDHLENPQGLGLLERASHRGSAGGAACGDVVDFRVECSAVGTLEVGFDCVGCGALTAAASAATSMATGQPLLDAARISTERIADELGGLPSSKIHAAELVCDALHRAIGSAAGDLSLPPRQGRRLVAMSGGVDSSVVAALSAERGEAVGVTLELWRDDRTDAAASCCSHVAVRRARSLAHAIGIPHLTLDLRDEFRSGVVDPWLTAHADGLTPNPCIQCNGRVRIGPMTELAGRLGAERLVTGHYARLVERDSPDGPLVGEGVDRAKDQAYALARVPARVLAAMDFPLGELTKEQVRQAARDRGLEVAEAPDSQDLCFIAGIGRERFLAEHGRLGSRAGAIVDSDGRRLGTHRGFFNHTVGQRRGLGIGGGTPLFVIGTDARTNTVTVGGRDDLRTRTVVLEDVDLRRPAERIRSARLRHHAGSGKIERVEVDGETATLHFVDEVERVAPGQVACLLDGETVVGCGTVSARES